MATHGTLVSLLLAMAVALTACQARPADKSEPGNRVAYPSAASASSVAAIQEEGGSGKLGSGVLLPEGMAADEYVDYISQLDAYEVATLGSGERYKKGRLGVWFESGCGEKRARAIVSELGTVWLRGFSMHDGSIDVEVELPPGRDEQDAIGDFEAYPEVRFATLAVVSDMDFGTTSSELVAADGRAPSSRLFEASAEQKYHLAAGRGKGC